MLRSFELHSLHDTAKILRAARNMKSGKEPSAACQPQVSHPQVSHPLIGVYSIAIVYPWVQGLHRFSYETIL